MLLCHVILCPLAKFILSNLGSQGQLFASKSRPSPKGKGLHNMILMFQIAPNKTECCLIKKSGNKGPTSEPTTFAAQEQV